MITYYWCCPNEDDQSWERRLATLPVTLRSYILTKGTPKQRLQSTYGYWLLQQMLHYTAAGNLDDLLWLPSGHPVWKKQLPPFSISHSGTLVGVALSQLGRIGLDIQDLRPLPASAVDSIFFNTSEQQIIQQASANHSFLIEFWAKKEALTKAVGGTMLDLAQQIDARFQQTLFQGSVFHWLSLPHPQKGVVWLASDIPFDNFSARKWTFH